VSGSLTGLTLATRCGAVGVAVADAGRTTGALLTVVVVTRAPAGALTASFGADSSVVPSEKCWWTGKTYGPARSAVCMRNGN